MTKITTAEVEHLAQLTKLHLDKTQLTDLAADLNELVGYVDQLSEVNVSGLEPTAQVTGLTNVNRPDDLIDYGVSQAGLLKNTTDQQDGYIKVPKVL
jgi:aspartyl-tRNA(Asn)/glutamyl-tRNA(Gln) amidotransferase subunit C